MNLARGRKFRYITVDGMPFITLLLALFLLLGVFGGYLYSARCLSRSGEELARYFEGYLALSGGSVTAKTALQTAFCYLRAPAAAFLLGFASIGIALLPALLALQGFLLSFSLFSFAAVLGKSGFFTLFGLFAIRFAFVLPCTLLTGAAAFEKSRALFLLTLGNGRRTRPVAYGTAYWYRFGLCCVCLLVGSALELWLVPRILLMAAA